jgi:DNA-binding transcriptional regulator YhcF (GntR family)
MLRIKIENNGQQPIYKQIVAQISDLIRVGSLSAGQRLPSERELGQQLGLARGTVKKAYDTLAGQNLIVARQGRGSIVAFAENSSNESSKIKLFAPEIIAGARQKIRAVVSDLEIDGLSFKEIEELVRVVLDERKREISGISIAAVDCNPEALGIYHQQMAIMSNVSVDRFLFQDLDGHADLNRLFSEYDMILTTSNHIEQLRKLVPELEGKCIEAVVAPSQKTLISLARIAQNKKVGVIFQSQRFLDIMGVWLARSGYKQSLTSIDFAGITEKAFAEFIKKQDVLIVPPGLVAKLSAPQQQLLKTLRNKGLRIIDFAYQIERGSLLHLEALIKSLLNKSRKQV